MEIRKINIEQLSYSDSEYDFFNTESIIHNDLYRLPLLSGNSLIWGHNIVRNAEKKGIKEIYCRILSGSSEENLIAALEAEGRTDSFNWFEKEKILNFMKKSGIDLEKRAVLSLIQEEGSFVPNTEKFADLPAVLKNITDSNFIDLKTAGKLEVFDNEIIEKITDIIKDFSFSKKRLFINYLVELYKKGNSSREQIAELLDSAASSENPFDYAAVRRYPLLKALEKDFSIYLEKYLKNSGIQLKSPPNFEGGGFTVQFSFKSEKQLARIIERLEKVRDTSDEILRLL